MRSRAAVVVSGVACAVAGAWQGCSLYGPSLLVGTDGSNDVVTTDAPTVDAGDGCNHKTWPLRPTVDDGDASLVFYNAIQSLDLGESDGGANEIIGFDLDHTCTCPGPDSCITFPDAGTQCDDDGGVDNRAGDLIRELADISANFDQGYLNEMIAAGVFGALFRIDNYNGQANDPEVTFSIFTSNGTIGAGTDAGPTVPLWDGTDIWTLDPGGLVDGGVGEGGPMPVTAYDLGAYVSNYTLVANISNMPLAIGTATNANLVTVQLSAAKVVATLTPLGDGTFRVAGTVAGRWQSQQMLTSLQNLHDTDGVSWLCGSNGDYQFLKARICSIQDIATDDTQDNQGAMCTALSLAFNFVSLPANYGPVVPRADAGSGCGPTWTDQCEPW